MRRRISIRGCVRLSVRPSIGPSVRNAFSQPTARRVLRRVFGLVKLHQISEFLIKSVREYEYFFNALDCAVFSIGFYRICFSVCLTSRTIADYLGLNHGRKKLNRWSLFVKMRLSSSHLISSSSVLERTSGRVHLFLSKRFSTLTSPWIRIWNLASWKGRTDEPTDQLRHCTMGRMTMKSARRVLGHSLLRLLLRSHRSPIRLLRTARFTLRCAHSLANLPSNSLQS